MPLQRDLSDSVIVVTGASSGIGAATAVRLAQRGATVVLAARRPAALETVARWCTDAGGRALAVPTDVREHDRVVALAAAAGEAFGGIDGWVNCAGVGSFGAFVDSSMTEFRHIVETNLLGTAHGSSVALRQLRLRGGGVLVNVASVLSEISVPYLSGYNATKHAVRALTDTVRQELIAVGEHEISVCTVLPATVDTPFYQHAANHTGRSIRQQPPVYDADTVARRIIAVLQSPRRDAYVGRPARLAGLAWRLMPGLSEWAVARYAARTEFGSEVVRPTQGNVVETSGPAAISGGWTSQNRRLLRLGLWGAGTSAVGLLARRLLRPRTH